jgi:predicted small lipoprotein YifL
MKDMKVERKKIEMKTFMVVLAACLVFAFQGCGRKGPPIPPGAIVPPKVSGLSHTIQGDTLTLTWKAPEGQGAGSVEGYEVLRSSTSLEEKECTGCPISFERAARLGSSQTSFTDKLVLGDRKSTRLNSSHRLTSRMPSSA